MKKLQSGILGVITTLAMMVVLAGCYPDESASIDDLDIVLTTYDSIFNFSGIATYIMPDTVISIFDPDNPSNSSNYDHTYDAVILSEVAGQFGDLGYERLTDTLLQKPDVGVMLSVISTTYSGVYNYSVGTLIVTMIDLKSGQEVQTDSVSVVWMGVVNGLSEGSNIQARVISGIDQMFIQSPYL